MSAILEGTPDKRLVLVTGRAYPELAEKVAECLGTEILETTSYDFANGEMYVRFTEPVRGADVFVLQCHSGDINKVDHGTAHHDRCFEARLRQVDYRGGALPRLLAPG